MQASISDQYSETKHEFQCYHLIFIKPCVKFWVAVFTFHKNHNFCLTQGQRKIKYIKSAFQKVYISIQKTEVSFINKWWTLNKLMHQGDPWDSHQDSYILKYQNPFLQSADEKKIQIGRRGMLQQSHWNSKWKLMWRTWILTVGLVSHFE